MLLLYIIWGVKCLMSVFKNSKHTDGPRQLDPRKCRTRNDISICSELNGSGNAIRWARVVQTQINSGSAVRFAKFVFSVAKQRYENQSKSKSIWKMAIDCPLDLSGNFVWIDVESIVRSVRRSRNMPANFKRLGVCACSTGKFRFLSNYSIAKRRIVIRQHDGAMS